MRHARVEITGPDIAWFRRHCGAEWCPAESGAPYIETSDGDSERLERVLLAHFLHARFESAYYRFIPPVAESPGFENPVQECVVSKEQVRLFRHTKWKGPCVDPKRPYGASTYYVADMAKILGLQMPEGEDGRLQAETEAELKALHRTMLYVLQAYIQQAELEPGKYLIPFDGFAEPLIRPRCQPISQARMDAYVEARKRLAGMDRFSMEVVIARVQAAALLTRED